MVQYVFLGKYGQYYKLNANCSNEEKGGKEGPGSCGGGKRTNHKKAERTPNSNAIKGITILKHEVSAKKERSSWESPDAGYEPIEFKLANTPKIDKVTAELSLPGFSYREGPFTKWREIPPIKVADVIPCIQKMNSLMAEEKLPAMKSVSIEANRFGRTGSAMYHDDSISIDRSIFSQETVDAKIRENIEHKQKYGRLACTTGLAKNVQDLADICVTHEVGHHSITTYVRNNGGPTDVNEAYLGDQTWKSVINEVINDNWKPPTKYSEINTGELFAECYTYYRKGLVKELHPKIINYIENVISFNKNNITREV